MTASPDQSSVFGDYARYYELLYRDKDYEGEARYVDSLLRDAAPEAQTVLELGCGTGRHALFLSRLGYRIHGVELSPTMREQAERLRETLPGEEKNRLAFTQGDLCTVRIPSTFDAVISLFHVMSYQTTEEKLDAAFETARTHLRPGGIFLFDCWHGPAVLAEKPEPRVKELENEKIAVVRHAEPVLKLSENVVDVHYRIAIRDKATGARSELNEVHAMRYLFREEIERLSARHGFELASDHQWMTRKAPGASSWNVCYLLKLCSGK